MYGTAVNPAAILAGDEIATKWNADSLQIFKSRKIRSVAFCPSDFNKIHLDHECYDTRFSTVVKK